MSKFKLVEQGRFSDGREFEVENVDADEYRLEEMLDVVKPAGEVCCRLGIANPFGVGRSAELTPVRLERIGGKSTLKR